MRTIACPECGEEIDVESAIDNCYDDIDLDAIDCGYYRVEIEHECEECGNTVMLSIEMHIAGVTAYAWDEEKNDYDYNRYTESD